MIAHVERFEHHGFVVLREVFVPSEVADMIASLDQAFARANFGLMRSAQAIFGARNLLQLWPVAVAVWRKPRLVNFLTRVLGPSAGLVRGLYFDKPPEQSWALPF